MITIGVLVPIRRDPLPPEQQPLGRAALSLPQLRVIFGDQARDGQLRGFLARPGHWQASDYLALDGVYDRFPNRRFPAKHAALRAALAGLPFANPWSLTRLCRDKVRSQQLLVDAGLPMPAIEPDPNRFAEALHRFGVGYLKPRYGCGGHGVTRVIPGSPLPSMAPGAIETIAEPTFLQAAVPPPSGWHGLSVRVNVQREVDGSWVANPAVLRRSRTDWVVNATRGADLCPASDVLTPGTLTTLDQIATAAASVIAKGPDGHCLLELGVDAMIDAHGQPWIIEINSKPWGRVQALALAHPSRYSDAHLAACGRPLRVLGQRLAGMPRSQIHPVDR